MQALLDKLPAVTTPVWLALWAGLACLTLALLVLMWTRWGQSRPLRKCVVLSLLAHLLMAGFATTVSVGRPGAPGRDDGDFSVSLVEEGDADDMASVAQQSSDESDSQVWEQLPTASPALADVAAAADPFHGPDAALKAAPATAAAEPISAPAEAPVAAAPAVLATEATKPVEAPLAPAAEVEQEPAPAPAQVASAPGPTPDDVPPPAEEIGPELSLPQVADQAPNVAEEPLAALPAVPAPAAPELPQALADAPPQPSPATSADWASDQDAADPGPQPIDPAPGPFTVSRGSGAGSAGPALGAATPGGGIAIPGEGPSAGGAAAAGMASGSFAGAPNPYQLRTSPGRAALVERQGGSAATEQAVEAALKWLASAQSPDGRWDADRYGAGRETQVEGRDRGRAGADADTGVTGLALLAFLGAGHTHQRGPYRENVQRGLDFLLRSQADNGNLSGHAQVYAMMYSHGMATLALGEAYAMTQDVRLRLPLERAIAYTLSAQHPSEGGWRYRPGDRGDTSQLGWQLMALRSAESSGIALPLRSKQLMIRYLKSVSYGQHGGLAAYRPGERTTRPMTAEALVCRQFLGMARSNPASDEAGDFLMTELPGQGLSNLYYWYYATLGAYQLQGEHWQRWNEALQNELVRTQRKDGELTGSWDVDQMWGTYGGRIYSTALGAMCLEVYYRYLPLYAQTPSQRDPIR